MWDVHLGEFLPPLLAFGSWLVAYGMRARTLSGRGRPVPRWRIAMFVLGVVIAVAAVAPPIDDLADTRLSAHMVQHLLLADIAALAITLGLTGPLLGPLLQIGAVERLRALAHPVPAFLLWAADLYVWHLPALYQAALRNDLVHSLEHALFFWLGVNLWLAVLGPLPKPAWFTTWAKLGYIVAVRFTGAVLANVFIWSETVFYPYYRVGLGDQSTAGAVMMVEETIFTLLLLGWLFAKLAQEDAERQELIELARRRGVPLSEERAARAAAAGAGARMRARLEDPPPP